MVLSGLPVTMLVLTVNVPLPMVTILVIRLVAICISVLMHAVSRLNAVVLSSQSVLAIFIVAFGPVRAWRFGLGRVGLAVRVGAVPAGGGRAVEGLLCGLAEVGVGLILAGISEGRLVVIIVFVIGLRVMRGREVFLAGLARVFGWVASSWLYFRAS